MVGALASTQHEAHRLSMASGSLVSDDERGSADIKGPGFGVFRAHKSIDMLNECVEIINSGGIASLVPVSVTESYASLVATELLKFSHTSSIETPNVQEGYLVLPTSGSTGAPKLVALPAEGVRSFLSWCRSYFGLDEDTVSLSLSPWNFDVSLLDSWSVLAAGGHVIAAQSGRLFDRGYLRSLLSQHSPTLVQCVPATLDAIIADSEGHSFPSVKDVILTGGAASRSSRHAMTKAFPGATFHNIYGATEVNDCLINTMSPGQFGEAESLSLGVPIRGCDVYLSTGDHTVPMSDLRGNETGEIQVRTPWMSAGYVVDGTLQPLPKSSEALYPMRDRALYTDGGLSFIGRTDRTAKIRGQRINLDEIEEAARRTGFATMAVAWIAHTDDHDSIHLVYVPTPSGGTPASSMRLRMALSSFLPAFAMPNHVHQFANALPLNGNGKPDLDAIQHELESR